jgi:hypothetical protein
MLINVVACTNTSLFFFLMAVLGIEPRALHDMWIFYHLSCVPSHVVVETGSLYLCSDWSQTHDPPAFISQVAGTTDMQNHAQLFLYSFLWLNNFIVLIFHILFNSWWTFEWFPLFGCLNNAAMNKFYMDTYLFSVFLGVYLRMELLGHMVILCLTFWRTASIFYTTVVLFYNPITSDSYFILLFTSFHRNILL